MAFRVKSLSKLWFTERENTVYSGIKWHAKLCIFILVTNLN